MKLNKYLPFAFIYFFVNSVGLPFGLVYTTILGPFFYLWVLIKRKKEIFLPFITVLLPFIIIQVFFTGVDLPSYTVSLLNMLLIYFFCQAFYTFLQVCTDLELIFRKLLVVNFFLCIAAIIFYFTPFYNLFWIEQALTAGVEHFRRLKLFTYEASYYAMLFVPLFVFYFLQYALGQNKISTPILLIMIILPLVLSFSIGVTGALLLSGFITLIIHFRKLMVKRRVLNSVIWLIAVTVFTVIILFIFFRHNPVFARIVNIFYGEDISGQGRTSDAFILATKLLKEKNEYWGIGPGQVKIIGQNIIRSYYLYVTDEGVAIPNAAAETLALFGWVGFILRLLIEIGLFFYTRVWTSYYRLLLFFFVFIYQFTGSFITNGSEYVIWILAFTHVFKQFDIMPVKEADFRVMPPQTV